MNCFYLRAQIRAATYAVALLSLVLTVGCRPPNMQGKNGGNDDKKKEPDPVPVEVVDIKRGEIESILKASTTLEAESNVPVFARTVNQVKEIRVEEGDHVDKDDVLLVMVDDIQRTTYNKAKTQMLKAQQEFNRVASLYEQNLVSEEEYLNKQLDFEQLKLSMEEADRELGYTVVKAPIGGVISQRSINVGDFVGSQRDISARLFDIVDFDSIVAVVYIPEKNLSELRLDQRARVYSPSMGEGFTEGYVMRISPVVDSATGTVKVTIGFKDVGKLRPGMYVNVEIITYVNEDAILVPKETLVYDADQIFAFRLVPGLEPPKRTVEKVMVLPRLADKFNIEPVAGIEVGDKLVAAGKTGLKDETLVRLPGDPKPEKKEEGETGEEKGDAGEQSDEESTEE